MDKMDKFVNAMIPILGIGWIGVMICGITFLRMMIHYGVA